MNGTHLIIPRGLKNIIIYMEEHLVPFIENLPQPSVNYTKEDLGTYSIFCKDDFKASPSLDSYTDKHSFGICILMVLLHKMEMVPVYTFMIALVMPTLSLFGETLNVLKTSLNLKPW